MPSVGSHIGVERLPWSGKGIRHVRPNKVKPSTAVCNIIISLYCSFAFLRFILRLLRPLILRLIRIIGIGKKTTERSNDLEKGKERDTEKSKSSPASSLRGSKGGSRLRNPREGLLRGRLKGQSGGRGVEPATS
jgi:hypothetical protein